MHETNANLLVFAVVPIIENTLVLSKAAVGSDAICSRILLYDDLIVHSGECICDEGVVIGEEALIKADFGDVKRIWAGQEPEAGDVRAESAISSKSHVTASCNLGRWEGAVKK